MNFIKRLFWPVVVVMALFAGSHWSTVGPQVNRLWLQAQSRLGFVLADPTDEPSDSTETESSSTAKTTPRTNSQSTQKVADSTSTNSTSQTATVQTNGAVTPMESIVRKTHLANTYYYKFSPKLSAPGRQVFKDAVKVYNQTGIVHLIAGQGSTKSNQITFSVYHKAMPEGQRKIELGEGGPAIYHWTSLTGSSYDNHATASINGDYASAFSDSVAIHELGHALGLDHSTQRSSVMYPMSQGRTQLSAADLAGLQKIYAQ